MTFDPKQKQVSLDLAASAAAPVKEAKLRFFLYVLSDDQKSLVKPLLGIGESAGPPAAQAVCGMGRPS